MAIFTYTTGASNGFYIASFAVSSAGDLNALANGSATTLAGGTIYTQAAFSSAIWGYVTVKFAATAFTPTAGGYLAGWFAKSHDGSIFESLNGTPSTTVQALPRNPDFII